MSSIDVPVDIEKHADAIVRVCSYHRRDFDLVVVHSRPHHMQPVEASLQAAFETRPTAGLGIMDRLPAELMSMVLHELDVRSFFHFRQVNRQARVLSAGLWEYRLVSKHGLEGLRGLLRAKLAHHFTIDDLYRPLLADRCSTCEKFGGLLFLFTAERCCFDCLQSSARYRVVTPSAFAKAAKISPSRAERLAKSSLRTVPGIYNMMLTPARRPKCLVFEERARQVLLSTQALKEPETRNFQNSKEQPNHRFMTATAYLSFDLKNGKLERGVSCKGCQVRVEQHSHEIQSRDQVFSARDFLSHFSQCAEARQLWAESEDGTRPINEPYFTRCCGFFSHLGYDGLPA